MSPFVGNLLCQGLELLPFIELLGRGSRGSTFSHWVGLTPFVRAVLGHQLHGTRTQDVTRAVKAVAAAGVDVALEFRPCCDRLTLAQIDAHAVMRAAGANVGTSYGVDDALTQLKTWGLLRGRAAASADHAQEQAQ
jgi:hypothetical protein